MVSIEMTKGNNFNYGLLRHNARDDAHNKIGNTAEHKKKKKEGRVRSLRRYSGAFLPIYSPPRKFPVTNLWERFARYLPPGSRPYDARASDDNALSHFRRSTHRTRGYAPRPYISSRGGKRRCRAADEFTRELSFFFALALPHCRHHPLAPSSTSSAPRLAFSPRRSPQTRYYFFIPGDDNGDPFANNSGRHFFTYRKGDRWNEPVAVRAPSR